MTQPEGPSSHEQEQTSGQDRSFVLHSPFDEKIMLNLDFAEYEGWIDWHVDSPEFACKLMVELARRRGWMVIPDCENEDLGNGWWRCYLVTIEVIYDMPDWSETMPDLTMTAYGPMSGFMEAIS